QASASSPDLSFDLELSAQANALPGVTLTGPAHGSVWLAPASLLLGATASDPYGAIASVQFLRDGAPLGADATAPYEFTWNNPPAGTHTLTAVATDNLGAQQISAPVVVTVVPPVFLAIESAAGQTTLSWPDTAPGYRLEATTNLTAPAFWQLVTNAVVQTNGQFRVPVTPFESQQFFRLRAP
ncbi:MAG: hypothetical protein KJ070_22320, partial [Verrucomicrobia bacterium]|nr:hypothetical protein [Verrucomicrobiota bacterium]